MSEELVVDAAARVESPSGESRQTDAHDEPGVTWMAVVLDRRKKMMLRGDDENTILLRSEAAMLQGTAWTASEGGVWE